VRARPSRQTLPMRWPPRPQRPTSACAPRRPARSGLLGRQATRRPPSGRYQRATSTRGSPNEDGCIRDSVLLCEVSHRPATMTQDRYRHLCGVSTADCWNSHSTPRVARRTVRPPSCKPHTGLPGHQKLTRCLMNPLAGSPPSPGDGPIWTPWPTPLPRSAVADPGVSLGGRHDTSVGTRGRLRASAQVSRTVGDCPRPARAATGDDPGRRRPVTGGAGTVVAP
jgi:hypothetical protein